VLRKTKLNFSPDKLCSLRDSTQTPSEHNTKIYLLSGRVLCFSLQTLLLKFSILEASSQIPKCRGKARPTTLHEGIEREYRYNSSLSLTSSNSALDESRWVTPRPCRFKPGIYLLYRRLGWPRVPFAQVRKILPCWDSIPGPSSP
jgi:hypothetical protein